MSAEDPIYRCPCGKAMPEPMQRIGSQRAICPCGQPVRLDRAAQLAYAERSDEPGASPGFAASAPANPEREHPGAPEPAGEGPTKPAPEPAPVREEGDWSAAEREAEVQLPAAETEAQPEPEPERPPAPPASPDLGSWLAG